MMQKYALFITPAGWMAVAATERGLSKIVLPRESSDEALAGLGDDLPCKEDAGHFTGLISRVQAYFNGERVDFPDRLDWSRATPFQRLVWQATRRIPRGETRSYAWVARQAGSPGAARAAGSALGRNPFPVIVPCHRVISADGSLGGFTGGLELKRLLLGLEAGLKCGSAASAAPPSP